MRIRFGKTFNLGNFETHHIELEVENVKLEKSDIVFQWLRSKVEQLHKSTKVVQQIQQEQPNSIDQDWLDHQQV
jgi:hypothetical protein